MKKQLLRVFLLLLILNALSCKTNKYSISNWTEDFLPPNGYAVAKNFYCDKTEIGNDNWSEYCYWLSRVYGPDSPQFLAALPDTTVWASTPFPELEKKYFARYSNVFYFHYPVVGIRQQQAKAFAKWRTDRVLEMMLIAANIIKPNPDQDSSTCFTVERYFSGNYLDYEVSPKVTRYFEFTLPTQQDRDTILRHLQLQRDATDQLIGDDLVLKENNEMFFSLFQSPTRPVGVKNEFDKGALLNLIGNVAEWSDQPNITFGGSWNDSLETVSRQDTALVLTPNAWTGFRNVCRWKKVPNTGVSLD